MHSIFFLYLLPLTGGVFALNASSLALSFSLHDCPGNLGLGELNENPKSFCLVCWLLVYQFGKVLSQWC